MVVVATEAASVVKVAAARRRWRWMGRGGGGGEWRREVVRPYPLRPKHPLWCSGGVWPHNLHGIGGVKKHRCLSRRNHRQ